MKKNYFYVILLIIYILFLCKDTILGMINNEKEIASYVCSEKESYYQEEYESLLNLVDLNIEEKDIIYSKILLRDIYEFYDQMTILKGTSSGIKKGDAVINEYGFIGVIDTVYKNYSTVNLITNNKTNISVKINDSYGILNAVDGKLIVKNIKLNHEINIGDEVYTSGLTSIPENIFVGKIESVNKDSLELEYILGVEQENHLMNIKYVGVIPS